MSMASSARFAAAAVPLFLVGAHALRNLSPVVAAPLVAVSGFLLGAYAAMFAANYPYY
jgi:hypothetical protein